MLNKTKIKKIKEILKNQLEQIKILNKIVETLEKEANSTNLNKTNK